MKWNTGLPSRDGQYIITTRYGGVKNMNFTTRGGWNTHTDSNGVFYGGNAIEKEYVRGWIPFPKPMPEPVNFIVEFEGVEE